MQSNQTIDMTEAQIDQVATEDWLRVLGRLWDAVGKPIEPKRLEVYRRELGSVPLGLLEKAVSRAIGENGKYQNVPTIGVLWAAVRMVLGDPYDFGAAIEAWIENEWAEV